MNKFVELIICLILIRITDGYGQSSYSAIIDWKFVDTVFIYDKPGGQVIDKMKNDSINEDFLHLILLDQTEDYFYVNIELIIQSHKSKGWIKKTDYIGAYKKHEQFIMDLVIYRLKKEDEENMIKIKDWNPGFITVEGFSEDWNFVSISHNDEKIRGWIQSSELCANAYTYCN